MFSTGAANAHADSSGFLSLSISCFATSCETYLDAARASKSSETDLSGHEKVFVSELGKRPRREE